MSTPSEALRQQLGETIAGLIDECGLMLLDQPLRLEGWLRDLYPAQRAAVSVVLEGLHTNCHISTEALQDVAARLALRAGVSPQWADFAVRVWRVALKGHKIDAQVVQSVQTPKAGSMLQTVESVLGQFRD